MNIFERTYAKQEYLTPGAAETVAMVAAALPAEGARVLDVASGKGEAACMLAAQGHKVLALDAFDGYLLYTQTKVRQRGLQPNVALVRANGRLLPFADNTLDAAYCIGAPSIVGLPDCPREMGRVTKPAGTVVVSDVVWRNKPADALGPEWGWLAGFRQLSPAEYAAILTDTGLVVDDVRVFGRDAWEDYHAPMRLVAKEARAAGDNAFADQVETGANLELRAADAYIDYAAFLCHAR